MIIHNGKPLQINDTITTDTAQYIVQDMAGDSIVVIEVGAPTKHTKRLSAKALGMHVEDAEAARQRAVLAKRKLRSYWED
jgi:hypothetical protein